MGLFTAKAQIVIAFNSGYTTLRPVSLNLDSDSYAIGRASNEIEFGGGNEKLIRQRIEKEVAANPMQVKSILNGQRELQNIPAVYITPHNVHDKKIVFAPYIVSVSRDIGFISYFKNIKKYRITVGGSASRIRLNGSIYNKNDSLFLEDGCKLADGDNVFEITFRY